MKTLILTSLISLLTLESIAQQIENYGDFSAKQWTFNGKYTKADYLGKPAIKLIRGKETATGASIAYLNNYTFSDGSIELDIATPFAKSMISFLGVVFHFNRVGTEPHYECFYFRPFMSGRSGAMQYMPINNGLVNWPDYQSAVYQGAPVCKTQQWFHVKIDVKGSMATVFVDGKQVYQIKNLARGSSKGSVGLWLGNTPEGYFANFKVTKASTTARKTMN